MIKFLLCLLIALLFHADIKAQYSDSTQHSVRLAIGGNMNKTNTTEAYLLNNNLRFGVRKKRILLNTSYGWVYGKQNNELSNNDFNSYADFNFYPWNPKFYFWGLGNYSSSLSLKINHQLQTGLGLAYNLIETERNWLNISNGILYEFSDVRLNEDEHEQFRTFRNSFRLAYKFRIRELIVLEGSNFIQNSFREGSDYIVRSNTALSFKLNKWLSLGSSLSYNRVSRTDRENLLFSYGLNVEKYF